ncbi:MAG: AGE family epimerase/isomerase [Pseudomonadota bacterium]
MSDLSAVAQYFIDWMRTESLPLWTTAGRDPEGGFYEDLDLGGQPRKDQIRRVRVQPRQAYVYAHAAYLGWAPEGQALSDHAFSYLIEKAAMGDVKDRHQFDGFVHKLTPDGQIADGKRDTYDHAFVLLACAWRYRAFQDHDAKEIADVTLAFLDRTVGEPDGSFREGVPGSPVRRQNPHMHLFEAFMALYEATEDRQYLDRATHLYHLFQKYFFDPKEKVLREFFTPQWDVDPNQGHFVEPGHMMEWCSLLHQYETLTGTDVSEYVDALYTSAERLGREADTGWLADQVALGSSSSLPFTKRTWVQTEYIKATLVWATRLGTTQKAAGLLQQFLDGYLKVDTPGGYTDQYGPGDNILSQAIPTSTLYHLMSLAAEVNNNLSV